MEETVFFSGIIILALQIIFILGGAVAIIYFAYQSYKKEGKEGFEDRDS